MTHPKRIQLSRRKGYKKPEGAIVVSRPSRWGNPFRVERAPVIGGFDVYHGMMLLSGPHATKDAAVRQAVVAFHTSLLRGTLPYDVEDVQRELRGKALACWCPLDGPCHADVLLKLANEAKP